jgi:hypothetical protein
MDADDQLHITSLENSMRERSSSARSNWPRDEGSYDIQYIRLTHDNSTHPVTPEPENPSRASIRHPCLERFDQNNQK